MRLTRGYGGPATGGCWMVAVQRYTEHGGWHDQPECVCPIIRRLCIAVNDWLPDGDRERVIGPHLFAPVGTRNAALLPARLRRVVQFALDQARAEHVLPELPTQAEYRVAADAAYAANANAANAAYVAANAAAYAAAYAAEAYAATAEAAAAAAAARAATWAAAEHHIMPLILELCAMSTPTEVAPVRTREQVLREVCGVGGSA